MKAKIIRIGNSLGIRLPKTLLEQTEIENEVKLELDKGKILISPVKKRKPREGWAEMAKKLHEMGGDELLIPDDMDLDFEGWEW